MKKLNLFLVTFLLLLFVLSGCFAIDQNKKEVELTISAAASLQDALKEIKENFEKEYPKVKINYNFGSSGSLQQQISQGAPVDVFFSAAEDKFDKLVEEGLIEKSNGVDLVGNELVLVVPNESTKEINSFDDLTRADKISIGTPEFVPAGKYAKESLDNLNVWKAIQGKLIYAKDVRQVLTYIETNNVEAGIVFKTDALISQKVKIVSTAKDNTHGPIIYPLGIIKDTSYLKEAQLFYDYLQNENSMKIFEKFGFKRLN